MADETYLLLLLAIGWIFVIHRKRMRRNRKQAKSKRFWVRDIFRARAQQGEYNNLVRELRLGDRELYFRLVCIGQHAFAIFILVLLSV